MKRLALLAFLVLSGCAPGAKTEIDDAFLGTPSDRYLVALSGQPAAVTNSAAASFSFAINLIPATGTVGYECSLDGASYAICTSPKSFAGLAAGAHQFKVRAVVQGQVLGSEGTASWIVDTTAPTVTLVSTPTALNNSSSAAFTFSGADTGGGAVASYQCKLDAGAYSACTSGVAYATLAQGAHSFSVKATDTAGNTGAATSYAWSVDLTAPTLSITANPASLSTSTSASFSFSGSDTGGGAVSAYSCTLDGTAAACTSPQAYAGLAQGSHSFSVTVTDTAGNVSAAASYSWSIDSIAPAISSFQLAGGAASVASPVVTISYSASDANGVTQVKFSEDSTGASGSWVAPASNLTFSLSQGGQNLKTVYAWAKDAAGNISNAASTTITLDYGSPPTVSLTSPVPAAGQNLSGNISLQWTCSSANGLDAAPVTLSYSPNSDGSGLQTIATGLTNNLSASTGSYTWAMPGGVTQFRILVACKSAAGVVSQVLSGTFNTSTWSIWAGDVGLPTENVNAYNALLTPNNTNFYQYAIDKDNNVFIYYSNYIRKIDAVTGQVTIWVGTGASCSAMVDGTVLSTATALSVNYIYGSSADGQSFYASVCNLPAVYKINTSSKVITKVIDIPALPPGSNAFYLTTDKHLLFMASWVIYVVGLGDASPAVTSIYGNAASTTCGAYAVGTVAAGNPIPYANPTSNGCGNSAAEASIFANQDLSRIYVGMWTNAGSHGYVLDNSSGSYKINSADLTTIPTYQRCVPYSGSTTKSLCAFRWVTNSYRLFDISDMSVTAITPATLDSGSNTCFTYAPSGKNYFMSSINGLWTESGASSSHLYGLAAKDIGMGQPAPANLHLVSPTGVTYDATNSRIYVVTATDTKVIDSAVTANITRTANTNNNSYPVRVDKGGTRTISYRINIGAGIGQISPIMTGTDQQVINQAGSTTGPFADGTVGMSLIKITSNLTKRYLPHSDGTTFFQDLTANNYILYKITGGKLYRVAGLTATAPGYQAGDSGGLATSALLSNIQSIQEIPSGANAGDLLISDGTWLRRISYKSEAATPKIYDVVNLAGAGFAVAGLTDFYYDFSSEIGGVLGTGKIYYYNGAVKRIQYDATLTTPTTYTYPFEGTTFSGNVQLEVTPQGLLVVQPAKNRVLKATP